MGFAMQSLRVSAGIVVWAAHFLVLYGFTALACARGFEHAVPAAVVGAGLAAGAMLVVLIVRGWLRRAHFEQWLSSAIAAFALIAVVYETIPAWAVPACA